MKFLRQISSKYASVKSVLRSKDHILIAFQKHGERMVVSGNLGVDSFNKALVNRDIIDEVLIKNK